MRLRILALCAPVLCGFALSACQTRAQVPSVPATVVATYPHDAGAFTEGLLIDDGVLIESTGLEGQSDIRKVELKTGKLLARVVLDPKIFGEGIVAWKDELISVTWHGGLGYRWSLKTLKQKGSFRYSGEGWGMTHDGRNLILSDGTPVLRFLDPRTLKVKKTLRVTYDGRPLSQINELEYVRGEIYANVWMTNVIIRIDPATGAVKGQIDVSALTTQIGTRDRESVPNGIAYDAKADRLFVTGKNWPWLFEIKRPE